MKSIHNDNKKHKNQLAELLEKEVAATSPIRPEPFFTVGLHTFREKLKKEDTASSNRHWHQVLGLRQTKMPLEEFDTNRFKKAIILPRNKL